MKKEKETKVLIVQKDGTAMSLGSFVLPKAIAAYSGMGQIKLMVPPGVYKRGVKEKSSKKKQESARRNGLAPCAPGKRRGRKIKWSEEIKKKIIDEIDISRNSAIEVCKRYKVSPSMVSRWRNAKPRKPKRLT